MNKISVIVPVYNSEKYLKKCLDSLINQTFKNIEIIIVNDGSIDDSVKIINNYKKDYSNIKLYSIENHGQGFARNYGLSKATGNYVSFVDSDDYVDVNLYMHINNFLKKKNPDIIIFDYITQSKDYKFLFDRKYNFKNDNNVNMVEYMFSDPCPWNKIYKKSFMDKINFKFPEGIIYEDYCYIPTLAKYNPSVMHIPECLYYYIYSDSSTTRNSKYNKKYEDGLIANKILFDSLKDTKFKAELEFIIYYYHLYLGSLKFNRYNKLDKIDEIVSFVEENFPHWYKNKYVKKRKFKEKLLSYLFYKRKYTLIRKIQSIKKLVKHEK